ncbi:MAG TPA: MFS transporter [Actinomycetota bacterium]
MSGLVLTDVSVTLGTTRILDRVSVGVEPGKIVCVVGPNGAGKTTLLDAICGVVPHSGAIVVGSSTGPSARSGRTIGRAFQGSPLPATLTVAETTAVVTGSKGDAESLMARFGLTPYASRFVSELSTGMKRILDIAVATAHEPELLILDEPSAGLAISEVEKLCTLITRWRDRSGAAVLVVEHDAMLVQAIADEVIVLNDGRVQAHGAAGAMLDERRTGQARLMHPDDPGFEQALGDVAAKASPATPLPRRTLSTWTVLRLGLREFAAGMSSVLILGVLNRVLKVELAVSLAIIAPILASLNLAAPLALGFGHMSDTRPVFGYRRVPYIIAGAVVAGGAVAASPHVAGQLAHGVTAGAVVTSLLLFVLMGIGMYGAGTVFFALIADRAPESERGQAASLVYLELIAGIFFGVILTASFLGGEHEAGKTPENLGLLFAVVGVLVVVLTVLAVWGQEPRRAREREADEKRVTFRRAVVDVASISQARLFFLFMVVATIFLFLQQAILEPFGGEVLDMDIATSNAFNAMLMVGILVGIVGAGRPYFEQFGPIRLAKWGLVISTVSYALLGYGAMTASAPPVWTSLFISGLGNGVFSVAGLSLMMGMARGAYTALFMGAWTVAHALAEGLATASGGVIYEVLRVVTGGVESGYATVFLIQAAGLLLCLPLLNMVSLTKFREQTDALIAQGSSAGDARPTEEVS